MHMRSLLYLHCALLLLLLLLLLLVYSKLIAANAELQVNT